MLMPLNDKNRAKVNTFLVEKHECRPFIRTIAFAAHLLRDEPLVAAAEDGLRALELSNAIHLSGWTGKRVGIPADREAFNRELEKRIATSHVRSGDGITYDTDHSKSGQRRG